MKKLGLDCLSYNAIAFVDPVRRRLVVADHVVDKRRDLVNLAGYEANRETNSQATGASLPHRVGEEVALIVEAL